MVSGLGSVGHSGTPDMKGYPPVPEGTCMEIDGVSVGKAQVAPCHGCLGAPNLCVEAAHSSL